VPWILHELARRSGVEFSAEKNPFRESNVYVTMQTDDDHDYIVGQVGDETLVIGTDYGHTDTSSEVDAIAIFRRSAVSDVHKHKVLSANPGRLWGIA
jgi:predicted TIM-barrel fold metal-dependent hydrolase